jgi:hypothetical protein
MTLLLLLLLLVLQHLAQQRMVLLPGRDNK